VAIESDAAGDAHHPRENRMKNLKALVVACVIGLTAGTAVAADRPYTMGSVWTLTLVRVKPGMDQQYLTDLAGSWKRAMDEAKKQDLVVSYKILDGPSANKDDWNLIILVESKAWSTFDTPPEKFDAIAEKMVGPEKQQMEQLVKRSDVREIVGIKNLQEIVFK
jgi:hypothetical protein